MYLHNTTTPTVDHAGWVRDESVIPIGLCYRLEGRLAKARRGLLVPVDDGGIWALGTDDAASALVGKRVKLEGTRSGFDRIDVEWIAAA